VAYDTQGRLEHVLYGSDAHTYLTYDIAGRKLTMSDPDLGDWDYTYDALGNLSYQDDAKYQRICMYYDSLNRLTGRYFTTDSTTCPSSPTMNATYTYDSTASGNKGIGRRTGMSNSSNGVTVTASWKYDEHGRTLEETRVIGSDTFKTAWTYNSADLPATMTYPGNNSGGSGELVTYNYHPQMLVNYVLSNTNSYYYVQNSQYDAGGRTEYLAP
jgi:YD repeat-containing protein